MILTPTLFLVPVLSWLDRQRGTPKDREILPKIATLALYGFAVLTILFIKDEQILASLVAAVLLPLNLTFGYGYPWGWAITGKAKGQPESWQFSDLLRSHPFLSLAIRGAWVGLPLMYFSPQLGIAISVGSLIGWTLSPFLASKLPDNVDRWAYAEYMRSVFIGLSLCLV